MDKLNDKVLEFVVALQDMYKSEEEREAINLSKLEFREEELTEDFTAMLLAVFFSVWRCDGGWETVQTWNVWQKEPCGAAGSGKGT